MSLAQYRRKRRFERTAEPRGAAARRPRSGHLFVVQKHDASQLHYDFRLEFAGVLKSWAVPKGPSLDPRVKRLAVEVEDHPLEYGSFEGTIPQGEYGGGTVMLWDHGEWEPLEDPQTGFRTGKLKFELRGEKLRGQWMLVRRHGQKSSKPQWLLFKIRDAEAKNEQDFAVAEALPLSITTGRDLDQIAAGERPRSTKRRPRTSSPATMGNGKPAVGAPRVKKSGRGFKKPRLPTAISPQLPTLVESPPDGNQWIHEIKFDGYRMLCYVDSSSVRFETRNHLDWTAKLPDLAEAITRLDLRGTILDGEIVAFDKQGVSDFQLLQNAFRERQGGKLVYTVFDLLACDGVDLRDLPLEERKARLQKLKLPADRASIRYTDHMLGQGQAFFKQAQRHGLEGIVSKRRDRPYVSGRGTDWVKVKGHQRAEFVIGGFSAPGGARQGFGALLIGYHDAQGKLQYAGRVGTGFSAQTLRDLQSRLERLEQPKSPFAPSEFLAARMQGVHWVRPQLVAEVAFSNWTRDQLLRQPSYQGLREDKPAKSVTREMPQPVPEALGSQSNGRDNSAKANRPANKRRKSSRTARSRASANGKEIQGLSPLVKNGAKETSLAGVRLTHPDKILYPDCDITKRDLAQYYLDISKSILPHVVNRPLAIVRCPDGVEGERFFQKHPGPAAPKELRRIEVPENDGKATYLVIDDVSGLIALAQIGDLEIHVWGARTDALERPDRLVFDLDPAPELAWRQVIAAALELRDFLQELGLKSFVKTSGGKGLHLVAPIQRKHDWQCTADFCRLVAQAAERLAPERFVATMSKRARTGKVFIDWLRNQRGATAVAAFSTRASAGAPVSLPLTWDELPRTKSAAQFTLPRRCPADCRALPRRLGRLCQAAARNNRRDGETASGRAESPRRLINARIEP